MIIHDIEQGTDAWLVLRSGLPTASNFKYLVSGTGVKSKTLPDYAATLAADAYAGHPVDAWEGNGATQRGTELEPAARAWYAMQHDVDVQQVGFVTTDEKTAGCSPDGLTDGMVEFKCQLGKNHVKTLAYYAKHKKCPPDYVPQVQGQMMICEREWCDIVFYHPELPSIIIRNFIDDKFVSVLREQIEAVNAERDRLLCVLKAL